MSEVAKLFEIKTYIHKGTKKQRLVILPKELDEQLVALAETHGASVNALVVAALHDVIESSKPAQKKRRAKPDTE